MLYKTLSVILVSILLFSCGGGETRKLSTDEFVLSPKDKAKKERLGAGGVFLKDLIGSGKDDEQDNFVVSYNNPLWKASLEALSNFPLADVDAKSGLIITEWYTSEKKPTERYKITVLLLSPQINSDSIKVSVHRQIIKKNRWVNKNIDSKKMLAIERKIIERAVELNL